MSKQIIIVGTILLVLVGGGLYLVASRSQNNKQVEMTQENNEETPEGITQEKNNASDEKADDTITTANSSRYVEYSETALEKNRDKRRVLFFYASWCPTCRIADPDLKENTHKLPEGLVVLRINYNDPDTDQEEKELAKKYGITYQHTFVQIDSQGKEITKWNGGDTEELLKRIKL